MGIRYYTFILNVAKFILGCQMTDFIIFSNNYNDLSTDRRFQFEFLCDRCGSGYRTKFITYAAGTVAGALDAANT